MIDVFDSIPSAPSGRGVRCNVTVVYRYRIVALIAFCAASWIFASRLTATSLLPTSRHLVVYHLHQDLLPHFAVRTTVTGPCRLYKWYAVILVSVMIDSCLYMCQSHTRAVRRYAFSSWTCALRCISSACEYQVSVTCYAFAWTCISGKSIRLYIAAFPVVVMVYVPPANVPGWSSENPLLPMPLQSDIVHHPIYSSLLSFNAF